MLRPLGKPYEAIAMARLGRRIAIILGSAALIIVVSFGALLLLLRLSLYPSRIADFHPVDFPAKADAPFFYSIGDELKFSDSIDPLAPTLMRAPIRRFLVSPNSSKIALVTGDTLVVINRCGPIIRPVVPVDTEFRGYLPPPKNSKPIGQHYFRDAGFQWSKDSKSLYLIGDTYYASHGGQLFSEKGELWNYDVETGRMQLVLKPFPADKYFLSLDSGVYFSVVAKNGSFQLEYFDGKRVTDVGQASLQPLPDKEGSSQFAESPFMSFDEFDYSNFVLPAKGVHLVTDQQDKTQKLEIGARTYLTFRIGNGIEGSSFCSETRDSVFLPGGRYFLVNAEYCGNYNGLLLIDTLTGKYQRLPPQSRAYVTLNTESYPHYEITNGGIRPK